MSGGKKKRRGGIAGSQAIPKSLTQVLIQSVLNCLGGTENVNYLMRRAGEGHLLLSPLGVILSWQKGVGKVVAWRTN